MCDKESTSRLRLSKTHPGMASRSRDDRSVCQCSEALSAPQDVTTREVRAGEESVELWKSRGEGLGARCVRDPEVAGREREAEEEAGRRGEGGRTKAGGGWEWGGRRPEVAGRRGEVEGAWVEVDGRRGVERPRRLGTWGGGAKVGQEVRDGGWCRGESAGG